MITGFGTFFLSCECIGKKDYCLNFKSIYIEFLDSEWNNIDTLKANTLTIRVGLCDSSVCLYKKKPVPYGNLYAKCLGCFDFLSSYKLTCQNYIISIDRDTIKSGSDLFSEPKLDTWVDDCGVIDIDSLFKLKKGINIFQFEVTVDGNSFSRIDSLYVDSTFGY